MNSVKLGHGEEWGHRYDFNTIIENHDVGYACCTLPKVGGITEMLKFMCRTSPAPSPLPRS